MNNNKALTHDLVYYRSYSRFKDDNSKESWAETVDRVINGLNLISPLTAEEENLLTYQLYNRHCYPSGRWLWIGGTEWNQLPENYYSAYNCSSNKITSWEDFARVFDQGMQGTGTGTVLEQKNLDNLPTIKNRINLTFKDELGDLYNLEETLENSNLAFSKNPPQWTLTVGDSRLGWVEAYHKLLELFSYKLGSALREPEVYSTGSNELELEIDLRYVRPAGHKLKGFGGVSNPLKLKWMFEQVVAVLNRAQGRQVTPEEACLLIDIPACCYVAGNIRRCLPKGSLVHTSQGLIPIENVKPGMTVQTPLGFRKVLNNFEQGEQEVFSLNTNGPLFESTANHRMAVLSDVDGNYHWKVASQLTSDDRLMHSSQALPGIKTELPVDFTSDRPENSTTCSDFKIPELTNDIAWLIGFTHGNGYVSSGTSKHDKPYGCVSWSTSSKAGYEMEIANRIQSVVSLFGLNTSLKDVGSTIRIVCSSIRLAEYFAKYIKQPKSDIYIPSFILQGSVDIRAAYLAGLVDSDGVINDSPPMLCSTIYESLARQVMAVASSLGLATRWAKLERREPNWNDIYTVNIPSLKGVYNNLISIHSSKGRLEEGQRVKDFTLSGAMTREAYSYSELSGYGFSGSRKVDINYESFTELTGSEIDIPVSFNGLGTSRLVETYDIEVEDAHCFYCNGYLTHNSAGIRQFDSSAPLLKQNLWVQNENGNWTIDEFRAPLKAANHTRVYHHKPSYKEIKEAVSSQFKSGEGAIQWAGEAVARANVDLLDTDTVKSNFLAHYDSSRSIARQYLADVYFDKYKKPIDEDELSHRMDRYGLNPCFIAGTMVLTRQGHLPIEELVGKEVEVWDGNEWVLVNNFRVTAEEEPVYSVTLKSGVTLTATAYHTFILEDGTRKELRELEAGDRLATHDIQVHGTHIEPGAYLKGFLLGDGTSGRNHPVLNLYDSKYSCIDRLIASASEVDIKTTFLEPVGNRRYMSGLSSAKSELLPWTTNYRKEGLPKDIYNWSKESKLEFIAGYLDADGTALDSKHGFSYQVSSIDKVILDDLQLLLLTLGIQSCVSLCKKGGVQDFGESRGGLCNVSPLYRLSLAQIASRKLAELVTFSRLANFAGKTTRNSKTWFNTIESIEFSGVADKVYCCTVPTTNSFALSNSVVSANCGEIFGSNFLCNLSEIHLNTIDPDNAQDQYKAFKAGALFVSVLLHHKFPHDKQAYSRQLDPIVAVCFTGLFDFFVKKLGLGWLEWWQAGRPKRWGKPINEIIPIFDTDNNYGEKVLSNGRILKANARLFQSLNGIQSKVYLQVEQYYLSNWQRIVKQEVNQYCEKHQLKVPNRVTAIQPSGSKSLLTGASSGWHPPFGTHWLRRITYEKGNPIAKAAYDAGYRIEPGQGDLDEHGNLLTDPFDPRVTEWLVCIPCKSAIADVDGSHNINPQAFSALAQMDFMSQVQSYYTQHNTSSTINFTEDEIPEISKWLYDNIQKDSGYISCAMLPRFDAPYPRLPFEVISKEDYELELKAIEARSKLSFDQALHSHLNGWMAEAGPAGCDSDKCLMS